MDTKQRIVIVFLAGLVLAGCSSNTDRQTATTRESRQSNMVVYEMYKYHGVLVEPSHNWFIGNRSGLKKTPTLRLDDSTGFFDVASPILSQKSARTAYKASSPDRGESAYCGVTEKGKGVLIEEFIVHFDTNKTDPLDLDRYLADMNKIHPRYVTISGHTDDRGNDSNNLELSKGRAMEVRERVSHIWPEAEFKTTWSASCPRLVANIDNKSRAINRRVHIRAYTRTGNKK